MGQLIYLKDVATLELNEDKCNGCGTCETVCPHGVMIRSGRKAQINNQDACMECGACAKNCRTGALTVQTGVGCANAIINAALGRSDAPCCGPSASGKGCC